MVSIVLADDHTLLRQGLKVLLESEPGFEVVGETGDGLAVADLVEKLQPTVLVLDLMLPGLHGVEVTRQVKKRSPKTHIVILSMSSEEGYVVETMRNGASAYVLKEESAHDLVTAVRATLEGKQYLSQPLTERAVKAYVQGYESSTLDTYDILTGREREILQLAAEGYNNVEIGQKLSISARTAEVHRAHVMRKMGFANHTDLVRFALRRGIIPMDR